VGRCGDVQANGGKQFCLAVVDCRFFRPRDWRSRGEFGSSLPLPRIGLRLCPGVDCDGLIRIRCIEIILASDTDERE
jgi:hypothetical protein